jgi:hypothetical protein
LTDLDVLSDSDISQALAVQRPLNNLRKRLPPLIGIYERNEIDPLIMHRLKQLSAAIKSLFQDAAYLFEQSKRGGKNPGWHIQAHMLRYPIEQVWKKCGRAQLSNKPDGPLVKVLRYALKAVSGRNISKHTISTELKRAKRRRGFTVQHES